MRRHDIGAVLATIGLVFLPSVGLGAQEPPPGLHVEDAETVVANFLQGVDRDAVVYSGAACPDEHPWYRAVVDRLAAADVTDREIYLMAAGWEDIINCGDPTVNSWFAGAFGLPIGGRSAANITAALLTSELPEHRDALRAAAFSRETPEAVRLGIFVQIREQDPETRMDFLFTAFENESLPEDILVSEILWFSENEGREEFVRSAARLIETNPGKENAGLLLGYLARLSALPDTSVWAVSHAAAKDVLDAIDSYLAAPPGPLSSAAVRAAGIEGLLREQAAIQERLAGG